MDSKVENKRLHLDKLRAKAESALRVQDRDKDLNEVNDLAGLIQDLQIYQVELEMQNDELFKAHSETQTTRDEYFRLYHEAPVGYATLDKRGLILMANQHLAELFQKNYDDLIDKHIFDLVHRENLPEIRSRYRAFFKRPDGKEITFRIARHDKEIFVTLKGSITSLHKRKFEHEQHLLVAITDITQLKQNEIELSLAAKVFDSSIEGIIITDTRGRIQRVNRAFTLVTGYEESEVIGKTPALLKSGKQKEEFYQEMWAKLHKDGYWQGEIVNKRKNGDQYVEWLSISSVPSLDGHVYNYVGIFSDITEKKLNTQQMKQLAYYDVLTGLPNRTLFYDRLKQSLVRAKRNQNVLALLFIDLDNFKELNDNHGHSEGDMLLQQVADRLKDTVRETDTVSRLGGDEFTVILTDFHHPTLVSVETAKVAEKILQVLSEPFLLNEVSYRVSASVGIANYPQDGEVISDLIKHADSAMYQAKTAGKNTFHFFSQQMFEVQQEKSGLKGDLHNALEHNEFALHYQPQICLTSNKVVGLEALIRWKHPEKGLLPPGFFISIAEEIGLINKIGMWVLHEALAQLNTWRKQKVPVPKVSVNLSVEQLKNQHLSTQVSQLLEEYDIPPEMLELEITETAMLKDTAGSSEALKAIKNLGVKISLDDFGTGYSSMTYVKHFPIDSLKIDRLFVRDIFDSIEDKSIVMASLSLANNLEIETIAEGVETQAQLEFLKNQGCTHAQGFLFAKPLSADTVEHFIAKHHGQDVSL